MKHKIITLAILFIFIFGLALSFVIISGCSPEDTVDTTDNLNNDAPTLEALNFTLMGDGTYGVSAKKGVDLPKKIIIPATYNNIPVAFIETNAFKNCSTITSIVIPEGINRINYGAFYECVNLTDINIPSTCKSIGTLAFFKCTSLKNITISDGIESIGNSAFFYCSNLENIVLPDSITSIENCAFSDCSNLKSVKLPFKLTTIGSQMFIRCKKLSSIEIPTKVNIIEDGAFAECDNLTSVIVPKSIRQFKSSIFYNSNAMESIYYCGTASEWSKINIMQYNNELDYIVFYYYSENQPTDNGDYWHYVDGIPTIW